MAESGSKVMAIDSQIGNIWPSAIAVCTVTVLTKADALLARGVSQRLGSRVGQ